jgi:Subtilase family
MFVVKPGREDALVQRLHRWWVDEFESLEHAQPEFRDGASEKSRHFLSWRDPDFLRQQQDDGRLGVFVACRVPVVRPAGDTSNAQNMLRRQEPAGGVPSRIVLMDTGVDEEILRAEGFDTSRLEWLPAPRRGLHGTYVHSPTPGDRRVGAHGTAMAAAIWRHAPAAQVIVLPVLDGDPGAGTGADILSLGITVALGQPDLQHVNFSLEADERPGGASQTFFISANMEAGVRAMVSRGAVVTAATGNAQPPNIGIAWPAREPGVIAIGAVAPSGDGFRRCTDSRYNPEVSTSDASNLWVEEGGQLENGEVVLPGISVGAMGFAGSSVAAAHASGRIVEWRSRRAAATGQLPDAEETLSALMLSTSEGLETLTPAERGHGWARPVPGVEGPPTTEDEPPPTTQGETLTW